MNDFLFSVMRDNEFYLSCACIYMECRLSFDIKIDVGAMDTLLPLRELNLIYLLGYTVGSKKDENNAYNAVKESLLNNKIPYSRAYTSETDLSKPFDPYTSKETVFRDCVYDFCLSDNIMLGDFIASIK